MAQPPEPGDGPRPSSGPRSRGSAGGKRPSGAPSSRGGDAPRRDGDARPSKDGKPRSVRTVSLGLIRTASRDLTRTVHRTLTRAATRDLGKTATLVPVATGHLPLAGMARRRTAGRRRPYRAGAGRDRAPASGPARDRETRPRHDDPPIDEDVQPKDLDRAARAELKTLSKENADEVAKHLVMAGRLIDTDPALAHRHALSAGRRAGRVGVVRETVAITAYATGDFALALRELRTYRRLTGRNDQLPLMVDSERGVGRPAAALELGRSVPRAELEPAVQVALAIAMSGARLDLGQADAALGELQIAQLDPQRAFVWSPALFDAYATVLEELGREEEAEQWWQRSDRATIALEQAAIPEGEDTVEIIEEFLDPEPGPRVAPEPAADEAESGTPHGE